MPLPHQGGPVSKLEALCNAVRALGGRADGLMIWGSDQNLLGRCLGRQSLQYTGLEPSGLKGTESSFPQSAHVILCISRGGRS